MFNLKLLVFINKHSKNHKADPFLGSFKLSAECFKSIAVSCISTLWNFKLSIQNIKFLLLLRSHQGSVVIEIEYKQKIMACIITKNSYFFLPSNELLLMVLFSSKVKTK